MTYTLAIHGAAGRMGQRLIALGSQHADFRIIAAIDHAQHAALGRDAGSVAGVQPLDVKLTADWPAAVDVAIDFSVPLACSAAVRHCLDKRIPLVVATTGLNAAQIAEVKEAAKSIPLCWAPSMSLAVNLTMKLAQQAAQALRQVPQGVDVEIIERHHRFKEDAPSGTALKFGEIIAAEMGLTEQVHGREGQCGQRTRNEIGYHAVRTGDNPGEHTIVFGMLGELIELRVAASNRDCYASGALAAAKFLIGKPPGLYNMFDVLGIA